VLFLVDACFSGYLSSKGLSAPASLAAALRYPARQIITAGTADEQAVEHNAWRHGAFTFKLLEILRNEAGPLQASRLGVMLKERVPREVAAKFGETRVLSPQAKYLSGEGDFMFIRLHPVLVNELEPPGPVPRFRNALGMEMVLIPAGSFMMGSKLSPEALVAKYGSKAGFYKDEHPRHQVRVSKPFYVASTEVTVGQFRRFVEATGYKTDAEKGSQSFLDGKKGACSLGNDDKWGWQEDVSWRKPGFEQTDDHPVVCVSWNDATAFCEWLSRKEGKAYRLPTEAQWEYACRGGTDTVHWWGDEMDTTGRVANVGDTGHWTAEKGLKNMPMDDGHKTAAPVGSYRTNGYGLHDMIGNVWEWCADWYGSDYYDGSPPSDPQGPSTGEYRVLRGGSWYIAAYCCRCADRSRFRPAGRSPNTGFRVSAGT
jgi:formylglycine-generating enzyme required for sulfatase activity